MIKSYLTKTKQETRIHEIEFENEIPKNWNIKYSNSVILPKTLVKYYSANEFGFKVLKEGKIWATHPFNFNDPFDCSIQLWDIDTFPFEETKYFLNNFLPRGFPSEADVYTTRNAFLEVALRFTGIYCLNDNLNSDLFWGYYNGHMGFSILFDSEILSSNLELKPFKIEYKKIDLFDKLSLIPKDYIDFNIYPKMLRWLTLKKEEWIHENEWRYIFFDINLGNTNRDRKITYSAINEIILGFKFLKEITNREQIDNFTTRYIFDEEYQRNYSFQILKFLFENSEIKLKQVALTEDFKLFNQRIFIKEMDKNHIIIVRE